MNGYTVLVVEDEQGIAGFMTAILKANEYKTLLAKNGAEALMYATSYCPDLIILDLGLPDMDGLDIIRSIRTWSQTPIIVVSARTHERDKVEALDLGADDYVTKPFGSSELLARVRTAFRHSALRNTSSGGDISMFRTGELTVDFAKRRAYIGDTDVGLTQNEFRIVSLLARYAGRVLTYDYMITNIWGPNVKGDNRILRVHMANIRRKIEKNPGAPEYIFTEAGVGYRMTEGDRS